MRAFDGNARKVVSALLIMVGAYVGVYIIATSARRPVATKPSLVVSHKKELCELCKKPLVADKEVLVREDGRRHLYRCVHCALTAMKNMQVASAAAKSGLEKREITITKKADQWSVEPVSAVFLILPEAGKECVDRHKVFTNEAEFTNYLNSQPRLKALSPKKYTLSHLEEMIPAGQPVKKP